MQKMKFCIFRIVGTFIFRTNWQVICVKTHLLKTKKVFTIFRVFEQTGNLFLIYSCYIVDTIEIVEESNSPQFNEMSTMTPVSTSSILSPDSQENTSTQEVQPSFVYSVTTSSTVATPSLRTTPARIISIPNSSNQIQSKLPVRTTVTILPTPKKPKTTQSQNVTNNIKKTVTIKKSPFIFPKTFQEKPTNTIVNNLKKSEEMTTPTAEVPDELPIPEVAGYDVLCNGTCEKAGVPTFPSLVTDEKSSIEETDAPITVVPISVPVPASISAPVPVYNRQNSFRNR